MSDNIRRRPKPDKWQDLATLHSQVRDIARESGYTGKIKIVTELNFYRGGLIDLIPDSIGDILQIVKMIDKRR